MAGILHPSSLNDALLLKSTPLRTFPLFLNLLVQGHVEFSQAGNQEKPLPLLPPSYLSPLRTYELGTELEIRRQGLIPPLSSASDKSQGVLSVESRVYQKQK